MKGTYNYIICYGEIVFPRVKPACVCVNDLKLITLDFPPPPPPPKKKKNTKKNIPIPLTHTPPHPTPLNTPLRLAP